MNSPTTLIGLVVGSLVFMGAQSAAQAEEPWSVLAEQTIKSADQGAQVAS